MNCYLHPEATAVAFCRSCGRPVCIDCQRPVLGTVYCSDHVPAAAYAASVPPAYAAASAPYAAASASPGPDPAASNPYVQPPPRVPPDAVNTSPGLAFWLGWIPGVGAIYNGQYLKGLVHALVFGLLVTLIDQTAGTASQPLFGILMMAFMFYMPFEAFHTAKKRRAGVPVEEWSSLMNPSVSTGSPNAPHLSRRAPIGPILLIFFGVVFLLDSLHVLEFREIGRFWPVLLILVGAYMLYSRLSGAGATRIVPPSTVPPASGAARADFMESNRE